MGGLEASGRATFASPMRAVSSSLTIFTTCWSGVSESITSAPFARAAIAVVSCLTTGRLTSASSNERRMARIAVSMSDSVSFPRPLRPEKMPCSLSVSASNIANRPL